MRRIIQKGKTISYPLHSCTDFQEWRNYKSRVNKSLTPTLMKVCYHILFLLTLRVQFTVILLRLHISQTFSTCKFFPSQNYIIPFGIFFFKIFRKNKHNSAFSHIYRTVWSLDWKIRSNQRLSLVQHVEGPYGTDQNNGNSSSHSI